MAPAISCAARPRRAGVRSQACHRAPTCTGRALGASQVATRLPAGRPARGAHPTVEQQQPVGVGHQYMLGHACLPERGRHAAIRLTQQHCRPVPACRAAVRRTSATNARATIDCGHRQGQRMASQAVEDVEQLGQRQPAPPADSGNISVRKPASVDGLPHRSTPRPPASMARIAALPAWSTRMSCNASRNMGGPSVQRRPSPRAIMPRRISRVPPRSE
jgi:hypothetical protein